MSLTQISSHQLHAFWKPNPLSCPSRGNTLLWWFNGPYKTKGEGKNQVSEWGARLFSTSSQGFYRLPWQKSELLKAGAGCWKEPASKGNKGWGTETEGSAVLQGQELWSWPEVSCSICPRDVLNLSGTTGFQLTYVVLELFSVALPLQLWYISSHGVRNHPQHLWALAENGCGRWLTGPVILVFFEDSGTFVLSNYLLGEAARKLLH